jgi:uncharacterized protein (TIGR00369 family)
MSLHQDRPRRTAAEQSRLQDDLRDLFENRITFNQTLGLHVSSFDPGEAGMEFGMAPALVGHYHYGRLHGGVISAVLDSAAGLVVMCAIGERFPDESSAQILGRFLKIGTIDLRVDFLRQGLGKRFAATATLVRLGGRVASTQMALRNDEGVLIATGAAAYVVS